MRALPLALSVALGLPSWQHTLPGAVMRRDTSMLDQLVKGALAGALATWVMNRVTSFMYQHERQSTRLLEDRARKGRSAYESAAEKLADLTGQTLSQDQRSRLGQAIHWALGIGAGAAYSAFGRNIPAFSGGAKFGTAFWAAVDEGLVSLLGLTPPPQAFPWETHARGLAGHLAYGIVTERTLRVLDAVA